MKEEREIDFIYGRNAVVEALQSSQDVDKVFVSQSLSGPFEKELRASCKEKNVPLIRTPHERLKKYCRSDQHQGVVAFVSAVPLQDLDDIMMQCFEAGRTPSIVILEGVTDVRNVGAISRSAYVMGFDAMVILSKNAGRINADAVKSSAGAILQIPVCREKNMISTIEKLRNYGVVIVATDLKTDLEPTSVDLTSPIAIVMGSEDKGTTLETLKMADHVVRIPQMRDFDSLNVSVAAGMLMYEVVRQRNN